MEICWRDWPSCQSDLTRAGMESAPGGVLGRLADSEHLLEGSAKSDDGVKSYDLKSDVQEHGD